MADDAAEDIREHRELVAFARCTNTDLYALLDLPSPLTDLTFSPTSDIIKKAFRKAAVRLHPDKNPGREEQAAKDFDQVSRARDVLLDDEARTAFENKWRAEAEKRAKHAALSEHQRRMVEDLNKREAEYARTKGKKRAGQELDEEEAKIARIAEETRRRREAKNAENKRLWEEQKKAQEEAVRKANRPVESVVEDIDRSVEVIWVKDSPESKAITAESLKRIFQQCGKIIHVGMLVHKKRRPHPGGLSGSVTLAPQPNEKVKRKETGSALVVFESIVGAHAAVVEGPKLATTDPEWAALDSITWARGAEPNLGWTRRPDDPFASTPSDDGQHGPSSDSIQQRVCTPSLKEIVFMRLKEEGVKKWLETRLKQSDEATLEESKKDASTPAHGQSDDLDAPQRLVPKPHFNMGKSTQSSTEAPTPARGESNDSSAIQPAAPKFSFSTGKSTKSRDTLRKEAEDAIREAEAQEPESSS